MNRPYLKVTKKLLPLERARGSEREGAGGESEGAQPKWPTERLLGSERLKLKKKREKKKLTKKEKKNLNKKSKNTKPFLDFFFHFHFYLVCLNSLDLSTAALYEVSGTFMFYCFYLSVDFFKSLS